MFNLKHIHLIFFIALSFIFINNSLSQDSTIIGTWRIIRIEHCRRLVYPKAEAEVYTVTPSNAYMVFYKDHGTTKSNSFVFNNLSSFQWSQHNDILIFRTQSSERDSILKVKIEHISPSAIKIKRIFIEYRVGWDIWSDVYLEKY